MGKTGENKNKTESSIETTLMMKSFFLTSTGQRNQPTLVAETISSGISPSKTELKEAIKSLEMRLTALFESLIALLTRQLTENERESTSGHTNS